MLRLKSSTAQSSRSEVSRQGSWGSAVGSGIGARGGGGGNPFPPLGGPSVLGNGQKRAAWTAAGQVPSLAGRINVGQSGGQGGGRGNAGGNGNGSGNGNGNTGRAANEEAFPALPQGRRVDVTMAGLTRGTVRWNDGPARQTNAWGLGAGNQDGEGEKGDGEKGEKSGTGKKGRKGKQVLYKFG